MAAKLKKATRSSYLLAKIRAKKALSLPLTQKLAKQ